MSQPLKHYRQEAWQTHATTKIINCIKVDQNKTKTVLKKQNKKQKRNKTKKYTGSPTKTGVVTEMSKNSSRPHGVTALKR